MIEVNGKYTNAKIFTDNIEEEALAQISDLCNQSFSKDCKVRIMPDTHAGASCVIGFTADLGDKVIPNIVGVDIGCGMLTVEIGKDYLDLEKLDKIINEYVPSGKNTHSGRIVRFDKLQELNCYRVLKQTKRIERSIGTLGGGNHFIEIDKDEEGNHYLIIHSGSRNLGKQVAEYYQTLAIDICSGKEKFFDEKEALIKEYKAAGRRKEIETELKKLKKSYDMLQPKYPKDLCYLTGKYREMYLKDMNICQEYALLNRETMAKIILNKMFSKDLEEYSFFHTTHNYINFKDNIIRKGSISAYKNEKLLIPINMRDGSILCTGMGNEEWNYSAPHGAGRLMSRRKAKETLTLEAFKKSMEGIYTTSINDATIDEAPMAYKPINEILKYIGETVDNIKIIKPIYNFKAN
ncbi:RNA-splicing ligase RtcB, repairs tRNA damage [Clostridium cavendishii DSM 21758]|uniref:3'-phosphate/5'-hydroxy nucleic acid ligase n=1 Tax=Clostridium cavendishii DSM 21758 TaxID=1121302 RepID=A0A1M6IQQ5_9CLOT|nr:RtcB family protein [Clostridium cavendishii]SHJ36782.1 RNA-splicing ligase RtcB, repairs tRNA damage [Clostridium cavendishii DSM 21758]